LHQLVDCFLGRFGALREKWRLC